MVGSERILPTVQPLLFVEPVHRSGQMPDIPMTQADEVTDRPAGSLILVLPHHRNPYILQFGADDDHRFRNLTVDNGLRQADTGCDDDDSFNGHATQFRHRLLELAMEGLVHRQYDGHVAEHGGVFLQLDEHVRGRVSDGPVNQDSDYSGMVGHQ